MSSVKSRHPSVASVCSWALTFAFRRWMLLTGVIIGRVAVIGLDLLKPWPMVFLVDYAIRGHGMPGLVSAWTADLLGPPTPMNLVNWATAATIVIFLLSWVVNLINGYVILSLRQRMNYDLASDVFNKLQQLALQYHARAAVADNMRRISSDSSCASTVVLDALLPACASALSLVAMFGILWRIDPLLALVSLTVLPCMAFVLMRFAIPLKEGGRELYLRQGQLHKLVEQSFSSMPVVQAFCREPATLQQFRSTSQRVLDATLSRSRVNLQFTALLGLATAAGSASILWIGGQKALAGTMSVGAIIAFLSYLGSLYGPLEKMLQTGPMIHDAANRAGSLWEVLRNNDEIREKRDAAALMVSEGHVRFENITFGYKGGPAVLQNVSFECRRGQTVALVGSTGSGKTTLVGLLPRFFDPWEGSVLIDGQDLRDVQLKSLRKSIGMVLQEPFLFPISVAENIAYGNPAARRDQIEAAARAANAHEFISKLPSGYDTIVSERGATFSGGERQRISIARALLKDPPLLILDEPTSALDRETETAVMQALKRLTRGRTTFVVAHRLSTVRDADLILVLKDGRIVERGTHHELVGLGGIYAHFNELQ